MNAGKMLYNYASSAPLLPSKEKHCTWKIAEISTTRCLPVALTASSRWDESACAVVVLFDVELLAVIVAEVALVVDGVVGLPKKGSLSTSEYLMFLNKLSKSWPMAKMMRENATKLQTNILAWRMLMGNWKKGTKLFTCLLSLTPLSLFFKAHTQHPSSLPSFRFTWRISCANTLSPFSFHLLFCMHAARKAAMQKERWKLIGHGQSEKLGKTKN